MTGFKVSLALLLCFSWSNAQEKPRPAPQDGRSLEWEEFCPTLNLSCPETLEPGQPLTFSLKMEGVACDLKPTFNWTVSEGTIIEGQGTPIIKVDTAGLSGNWVVATLTIGGFDPSCEATVLCKSFVKAKPIIDPMVFDQYGRLPWKEEMARLDNIAEMLKGMTDVEITILVFDGLDAKRGTAGVLAKRARRYLITKKGIKPELVRIVSDKTSVGLEVVRKMHLDFYINPHNNFFGRCH